MRKLFTLITALMLYTGAQAQLEIDMLKYSGTQRISYLGWTGVPDLPVNKVAVEIINDYGNLNASKIETSYISGRDKTANHLIEIWYDCGTNNNHKIGAWTFKRSFFWNIEKPLEYAITKNKIRIKFYMQFNGRTYHDFTIEPTEY